MALEIQVLALDKYKFVTRAEELNIGFFSIVIKRFRTTSIC